MKKIIIFIIAVVLVFPLISQQQKKILKIKKAFAYEDESLLISEADNICSYFIGKGIKRDILIVGAEQRYIEKDVFSDGDTLYINKGTRDGIKEGDMFVVMSKGKRVSNPKKFKSLGTYYLKKSLAEVTCTFNDKSCISLQKGCFPVELNDFLIPYKEEEEIIKKQIDYMKCRLPESPVSGNVVFLNLYMELKREISGPTDYVSIDMGKGLVARGDYVLFYKLLKKSLPPIIVGTGIVINTQNTNSTVKVLDAAFPVEIGDKVVLLPEEEEEKDVTKDEEIPIVKALKKEKRELEKGEESIEVNVLFSLDSTEIDDIYKEEIKKVKDFIDSKSQYVIILRGYTCSIGGLEYNLKLSKDRVEKIKEYLMAEYGIKEEFIETYYYGEKDAPFDNTLEEQRRKNRLVNIQVIGK